MTLYNIEAQIGDSPDFVLVYTTGARKFDHENQTPGVKIIYRLSARWRRISSRFPISRRLISPVAPCLKRHGRAMAAPSTVLPHGRVSQELPKCAVRQHG